MSDAPAPQPIADDAVPRIGRSFRLQFEPQQDAWVLLYPEGMVKLNPSAAEILRRCDGEQSVAQIIAALEQAFDQQGLGDDVRNFLAMARQQHWVSLAP